MSGLFVNIKKTTVIVMVLVMLFVFNVPQIQAKASIYGTVTGANVSESSIVNTYYVDKNYTGSSNGSSSRPYKTIAAATTQALTQSRNGRASKVIVRAGEYREKVMLQGQGSDNTRASLIVEGQGNVVVKGSIDFSSGWQLSGGVYEKIWPYDWGLSDDKYTDYDIYMPELVRRREMLYVNGDHLIPVLSKSAVTAGHFFVDETNDKIYMLPPAGVNMGAALIETADYVSMSADFAKSCLFRLIDIQNVVVRNIQFTQASSDHAGAAFSLYRVKNIKIENCMVENASYYGVGMHDARDITFNNVTMNKNGGGGIEGGSLDNVLLTNCETSYNSWRGDLGNFTDWDMGGIKFLFSYDVKIARHRSIDNTSPGIWFDSECRRVTIEKCYVDGNTSSSPSVTAGIYLEGSIGPFLVDKCIIVNNRKGLNLASSNDVTIRNSIIADNLDCQIELFSNWRRPGIYEGGRTFQERGKDTYVTSHLRDTVMENTIISTSLPSVGPLFGYSHNDTWAYDLWYATLSTSGMRYYHTTPSEAFFRENVTSYGSLAYWRQMTGLDADAAWMLAPYNAEVLFESVEGYLLNDVNLNADEFVAADRNCDSSIDILDFLELKRNSLFKMN